MSVTRAPESSVGGLRAACGRVCNPHVCSPGWFRGRGLVSHCYYYAREEWYFSGIPVFWLLIKLITDSLGVLIRYSNKDLYIKISFLSSGYLSDMFSFNNVLLSILLSCLFVPWIFGGLHQCSHLDLYGKVLNDWFRFFNGYVLTQVFNSFISQF